MAATFPWMIRPAAVEDVPLLMTMMEGQTPWRELGYGPDRCYPLIASHLDEVRVAVDGEGRALGFLRWRPEAFLGQPYLHLLAVAPDCRGRGVGTALVRWLEEEVQRLGAANLFLCVSAWNQPARRFYRRLGYQEAGVLTDYLRAGMDEILMRKPFRPLLEA